MKRWLYGMLLGMCFAPLGANAQADTAVPIHFFGRDDCKFCQAEKVFLEELRQEEDVVINYYNVVTDENAQALYHQLTERVGIAKITPVTVVGFQVIQGFDAPETTGELIRSALETTRRMSSVAPHEWHDFERILGDERLGLSAISGEGCDENGETCGITAPKTHQQTIPFLGVVTLEDFSLPVLSIVLGIVDGFNPCAMWVLLTFIIILSQIGDRRKMLQVAGLFLVAQAVLYYLILTVWFTAWDFVGLDQIVTPLVGLLALVGGGIFLRKWWKDKQALTCEVTSLEEQSRIQKKITEIAQGPLTVLAALGIIGIAFSVNIIEFACSIGVPQAFTKILEMNALSAFETHGYLVLFMLFYMIDDLIVLGLAIWGFGRLHTSHTLSLYSSLFGGILMVLLGLLLLLAPNLLVF